MSKELAQRVLDYMTAKQIWFVYLESNGQFVTDEHCKQVLGL